MAFRLAWGALPGVPTGSLALAAEGNGFTLTHRPFGPPGTVMHEDLTVQAQSGAFDFVLFLFEGNVRMDINFSGIGEDDIFNVTAVAPSTFLGGFFHRTRIAAQCTVICPNGTRGQGCVECRRPPSPLIIRVCC
jgi:hypothetical protein